MRMRRTGLGTTTRAVLAACALAGAAVVVVRWTPGRRAPAFAHDGRGGGGGGGDVGQNKVIMLATKFFGSRTWDFERTSVGSCPVSACRLVYHGDGGDDVAMGEADAVLFHLLGMNRFTKSDYDKISKWRKDHQRFLMFVLESPSHLSKVDETIYSQRGFFNWTMTYRRDSDVYSPYGAIVRKENGRHSKHKSGARHAIMSVKNKTVLWLVSNCVTCSEREKYARELSKHVKVDIVGRGRCGRNICKRFTPCANTIHDQYYFYLSFENSMCEDYVTEKFFTALGKNVVPIVLGGADYKSMAPPHSYIDIADFSSPRELAEHLKWLEQNWEEYLKYFDWKKDYTVIPNYGWAHVGLCNLCAALHDSSLPPKWYADIRPWLYAGSGGGPACRQNGTFQWSGF